MASVVGDQLGRDDLATVSGVEAPGDDEQERRGVGAARIDGLGAAQVVRLPSWIARRLQKQRRCDRTGHARPGRTLPQAQCERAWRIVAAVVLGGRPLGDDEAPV